MSEDFDSMITYCSLLNRYLARTQDYRFMVGECCPMDILVTHVGSIVSFEDDTLTIAHPNLLNSHVKKLTIHSDGKYVSIDSHIGDSILSQRFNLADMVYVRERIHQATIQNYGTHLRLRLGDRRAVVMLSQDLRYVNLYV